MVDKKISQVKAMISIYGSSEKTVKINSKVATVESFDAQMWFSMERWCSSSENDGKTASAQDLWHLRIKKLSELKKVMNNGKNADERPEP